MKKKVLEDLQAFLPEKALLVDEDVSNRKAGGLHTEEAIQAEIIVRPESTEEVSKILSVCNQAGQPVIVHGGLTGLVYGTRTSADQLILSLERMNSIEEIDPVGRTLTCQSGVTLQNIQEKAESENMIFPLDLGARGSCSIGGNISTNAGGNRVIRYGMTRDSVLGIEAVTSDGTILSSMNRMIKNNAGYDLKQLFIGTEGTLGIVTRCVLRLREAPISQNTALVGIEDFPSIVKFLKHIDSGLGGNMSAFEVMWKEFYEMVTNSLDEKSLPLKKNIPYYVLVESMGSDQVKDEEHFESLLQKALEDSVIVDAVLAKSEKERKALWAFRDDVEKQAQYGPTVMFDVSLPINEMEEYVSKVDLNLQKHWKEFHHIVWGHLADGNLHLVVGTGNLESDTIQKIENSVYEPLERIGGSISAEHGIGLEKKPYLHLSRSEAEINYMKALKDTFDPKGILNPGLIF
ncbi:MAG: FAD-binding oxidoreductase [SAR86 cluster bacterium]|nr:FAD-binding oxidoreductase [SAR86 cluster bacterium]